VFGYTISTTDGGVVSLTSPIDLNGGSIADAAGNPLGLSFSPSPTPLVNVAQSLPANTASPTISGVTYTSNTLTCTLGSWSSITSLTYAYQWQANGSNIPGATATSYTMVAAYEGQPMRCVVTASNGAGTVSATSNILDNWVPSDISASLALWLDAADVSTITSSSSLISQWNDKSPNARHASNTVPANRPTWGTFSINGRPVVSTAVTPSTFLTTAAWTPATTFDFFWVTTSDGLAQSVINTVFDHDHANAINSNWVMQSDNVGYGSSPNTTTHYIAPYVASTFLTPPLGNAANGISNASTTLGLFRNKATGELINAGNLRATAAISPAMTVGSRRFRLSGAVDTSVSGRNWRGGYGEVIYTNATLSTADLQRVEGYLAHKWGLTGNLPGGHPYKTVAP
jgi:hypothetical protein